MESGEDERERIGEELKASKRLEEKTGRLTGLYNYNFGTTPSMIGPSSSQPLEPMMSHIAGDVIVTF